MSERGRPSAEMQTPPAEVPKPNESARKIFPEQAGIVETADSLSYLGVKLEKAAIRDSANVPKREQYADYLNDAFALDLQKRIATAFHGGEPILLEGGTSLGKTTTVKKMCAELGYEVHYVNLTGTSEVEDLMGRYVPNARRNSPEEPEYVFADGKVTSGLRKEKGRKKVIMLDELNAAAPNVLIRLHEVLDALERSGTVVLSEDAAEQIPVDKEDTIIVGLMNPPGKGFLGREPLDPAQLRRWVYQKLPTELPQETLVASANALFGLEAGPTAPKPEAFTATRETPLAKEELADIPGLSEITKLYLEFHAAAKKLVAGRKVAADQPQSFTFDDRVEPRRVRDFVLRFYRGDINDTFKQALRYFYANKLETDADRKKFDELIEKVHYVAPKKTKRKGLDTASIEAESPFSAVDAKLHGIEANPRIPESVKAALRGVESAREGVSLEAAKDIMKEDFFGPEAAKKAFGVVIETKDLPSIPFSSAELVRAKELGQRLVYRIGSMPDHTALTMQKMDKLFAEQMKETGLHSATDKWKTESDFFTKDVPRSGWALASNEVLPGTTSKNYVDQTKVLITHLESEVFRGVPLPEPYAAAVKEFATQEKAIAELLLKSNWKKAAELLEGLAITKLMRQTPVEAFYDLLVAYAQDGKRRLPSIYTWTSRRSSDGDLVCVGGFGADGAGVGGGGARRCQSGCRRFPLPQSVIL